MPQGERDLRCAFDLHAAVRAMAQSCLESQMEARLLSDRRLPEECQLGFFG
jgi:hypothetical protein